MLLWAGCGLQSAFRADATAPADAVRLAVPFVHQKGGTDCGPAALASVLAFLGRPLPLEDITTQVHTPAMGRTLLPDMENFAASLGLSTRSGRGDPTLLRRSIDAGSPVILLLDLGGPFYSRGHYAVIYGHAPGGFLLHAGTQDDIFVGEGDLLEAWNPMNRLYLVVE
jgi:ABC-type bacteriocin/lantibiotic exporter with double-glycine peptidase domain